MSTLPRRSYDFRKAQLVILGVAIGGYSEDGSIELEPGADLAGYSVGADGQVTAFPNGDETVKLTITLKETSSSCNYLMGLARAQMNSEGAIPELDVLMRDLVTGDEISDGAAFFLAIPMPSKAKSAGDRVFVLLLPNALPTVKLAANF